MRKKMTLSVLVIALAMLLSFGAALDQAKADALLFPWVVKSTAISTVVSVVNTAGVVFPLLNVPQLHWEYFYKDPDNAQTTPCSTQSFKMDTSEMDIVTVDTAGNINSGLPMFGDPNNTLAGVTTAALQASGDRRAFLIVDNNTPTLVNSATNTDGTLYGEAMVIELATGAAWGYVAYNSGAGFGDTVGPGAQNGWVSFSNGIDPQGEAIGRFYAVAAGPPILTAFVTGEMAPVALMPPMNAGSGISTRFFLTPVDMISAFFALGPVPSQLASDGMRNGNMDARVGVCALANKVASGLATSGFVNDGTCLIRGITLNNEAPVDSQKMKNIVCTSADDISALIDGATYTSWVGNGGQAWTYMYTDLGNLVPAPNFRYTPNMMIGKLEWDDVAGTIIDGKPAGGPFNNFIHIRNNKDNLRNGPNGDPWGINNLVFMP
jgi:hypothetical protein